MKLAAIDIGSNAVRLLLYRVLDDGGEPVFKKEALIRYPLRLGKDAFLHKKLRKKTYDKLEKVMTAFGELIRAFKPKKHLAYATAAMRELKDGSQIVKSLKKASGIRIKIISGKEEAGLVYENHIERSLDKNKNYLYADVGGGSTELNLISKGTSIASRSFKIGTVRILNEVSVPEEWNEMDRWITENVLPLGEVEGIGSGGNINKYLKLSRDKDTLSVSSLEEIYKQLMTMDYLARIKDFGLKPDRAEVIIPAGKIFLFAFKAAGIKEIHVPQIGLADGMIHYLYDLVSAEKYS